MPGAGDDHSSDGLNEMVYNRCVGTRYCSNNCPYKVRRFNFLLYQRLGHRSSYKMQRNPDVTVRSRGVMEKCTYCVQRIREAEIRAQNEDGSSATARFRPPASRLAPRRRSSSATSTIRRTTWRELKAEKLDYPLLAELNTRPRTTYLAELRNPNPEIAGGAA